MALNLPTKRKYISYVMIVKFKNTAHSSANHHQKQGDRICKFK